MFEAQNFREFKFFVNFSETIFTDAVNITHNVHKYPKIFVRYIFEVGGRSAKNAILAPRKFAAIRYLNIIFIMTVYISSIIIMIA